MTGETVGSYRVLAKLGEGGMGVVFAAEDLRLGRRVAIKFLPEEACSEPDAVQRFLREARAISSLNHPHICTLHDIGEHRGQQYMVMELLEGELLKSRVARGPLPLEDVVLFGEHIADALDAAHGKSIVHRDLKPANLFITGRGQVKVLDFGVAKLAEPKEGPASANTVAASDQLTAYGSALGTIQYMSPEQARGLEIDARSDIFSLAIVLYEMATGRPPFRGATAAVIFEQIFGGVPPAPSEVVAGLPADLDRIVFRALEKDRELRYQSAADLRADLRRLRKAVESGRTSAVSSAAAVPAAAAAPPSPAPPMPSDRARSRHLRWMVAAPVVTVAVVALVLFWRSAGTPALASRDTVVLAGFVNRTGDPMFDDTLGEALGVQLRQSPFLNVLNEQQQQSTLRLMGREPASPVTIEIGQEVCQRNAGKAVLGGSIASVGSSYLMTLAARDCVTGEVLAEEQTQASSKDEVLRALGSAASSFRERLGESLASVQRYDARIEMATTPSLDALKQYSQGVLVRRTQGDRDAVPFFEDAIRKDPNFALAYARLGTVFSNIGRRSEAEEMTRKAFELRERVSERERLYIEARYHSVVTEDVSKAIETYRLLIATYPDDYSAHTNLGSLLKDRGEMAEAMASLQEAVRLAPEQPNGWLNLAFTHLENHEFAEARAGFDRVLKLQDSVSARQGLFGLAVVSGDEALEQAQIEAVRGRRDEEDFLPSRAGAAAYRGRFREGAELVELWERRMEQSGRGAYVAEGMLNFAISEALVGFGDRARDRLTALKAAKRLTPGVSDERLVLAAILGDADEARAALPVALAEARESLDQLQYQEPLLRALVALASKQYAEVVRLLEPVSFAPRFVQQLTVASVANQRLGRHEAAIDGLAWLAGPPVRLGLDASTPYVLHTLAASQEAAGRAADAERTRQRLADLWKNADHDMPLLRKPQISR
jgi:eukaryotic-like serine/threonine-protein kinase